MVINVRLDVLDANAIQPKEVDLREKLVEMNKSFSSSVKPEKGFFGIREIDKGNGFVEVIGKNEQGHTCKDYYDNGKLYMRRVSLGNRTVASTYYDDLGNDYLTTVKRGGTKAQTLETLLKPNTTIVKDNFTAVTDGLGRPVYNRIDDLQIRDAGTKRQSLPEALRDESYKKTGGEYIDHRGHIIADQFGGPASKENIVAQLDKVNLGKMKEVEGVVKSLKEEGHRVDFGVKTNYAGSGKRPTSFEPEIYVDGKEYADLPAELQKIYNSPEGGKLVTGAHHALIDLGERFGMAHEYGMHSAFIAAGLTFSVSTTENLSLFLDGRITAEEMVVDIVGDTAAAGALGYGTTFVSVGVAEMMAGSSNQLIRQLGGSCAPAAVVAFGVASFEDITAFADGRIDSAELAYNLGENAAGIAGGMAGGAMAGAALGAVCGPAGMVVGSFIGGIVGCAVASEVYATAVENGSEGIEILGSQVESLANGAVEVMGELVPEQVDFARGELNSFFEENGLPFAV